MRKPAIDDLITPKQVAQAIGVSESSIKRWCDSGELRSQKTAGGHRRLRITDVVSFCKERGCSIEHPELLRLPSNTGSKALGIRRAQELLGAALIGGEVEQSYRILADLYLAGTQIPVICDQVLAPAFHQIGDKWIAGTVSIYEERRACETAVKTAARMKGILDIPEKINCRAFGATLQNDHFQVANSLIDLTLTSLGWQTSVLGCNIPDREMQRFVHDQQPDLLWLSLSAQSDENSIVAALSNIASACKISRTMLVVGGRAIDMMEDVSSLADIKYFPNLQSLAEWGQKNMPRAISGRLVKPQGR